MLPIPQSLFTLWSARILKSMTWIMLSKAWTLGSIYTVNQFLAWWRIFVFVKSFRLSSGRNLTSAGVIINFLYCHGLSRHRRSPCLTCLRRRTAAASADLGFRSPVAAVCGRLVLGVNHQIIHNISNQPCLSISPSSRGLSILYLLRQSFCSIHLAVLRYKRRRRRVDDVLQGVPIFLVKSFLLSINDGRARI